MATAYAALISLMQIIEQTKQHPRPPISLDQAQVNSLSEKISFFQKFLENYSRGSNEANGLETLIADAAHDAADILETGIVDRINLGAGSTSHQQNVDLFEGLQRVICNMDVIMEGVLEMLEESTSSPAQPQPDHARPPHLPGPEHNIMVGLDDELIQIMEGVPETLEESTSSPAQPQPDHARPPHLPGPEHNIMVGLDDELIQIMDQITSRDSNRLILPIVGMAGIGKTTLARNIYSHSTILHHFDICAWTTVSQEYSTLEIFRELHSQLNIQSRGDSSAEHTGYELGEAIHRFLWGRRYLIILDDIWSIGAWDAIRKYFPSTGTGSRIIVTTRLLPVALLLSDSYRLEMSLLDENKSWDLFSRIVFGEDGCPLELREAAKKITTGCKGLPLSIVVIGGLLRKSEYRQKYWEHIADNFKTQLNLMDDERCSRVLYLSYNQLPLHLKPCFLYMGVFPEDEVIHVSMLIKLWVAEGFLKPIQGQSMEHVAQEYVRDLIDRNLVIVHKLGSTDNIKYCNIHDLLRDLCLREAQKEMFYRVIKRPSPGFEIEQGIENNSVRIVVSEGLSLVGEDLRASAKRARSLLCVSGEAPSLNEFQLLRILKTFDKDLYDEEYLNPSNNISHLVNLRYVGVTGEDGSEFRFSINRFWNLETLIVNQVWPNDGAGASEIWNMPLIRHVELTELQLPDPPPINDDDENGVVLRNLQTLTRIKNFKCSDEVVKRIRNVKKLTVFYDNLEESTDYCFDNFKRLGVLESFGFFFFQSGPNLFENLTFPNSLKKLTISQFHWEEMLWKIGSLPLLEKLKLINGYMKQRTWETTEEQFCSLKFLLIDGCNIECWKSMSDDFPRLKHLVLRNLEKLKEIPEEVGEIATLESIRLEFCSNSSVVSARRLLEQQQKEYGNMDIHVRVLAQGRNRRPRSSAAIPNFHVEYIPN